MVSENITIADCKVSCEANGNCSAIEVGSPHAPPPPPLLAAARGGQQGC
jgi:hypothetical protein